MNAYHLAVCSAEALRDDTASDHRAPMPDNPSIPPGPDARAATFSTNDGVFDPNASSGPAVGSGPFGAPEPSAPRLQNASPPPHPTAAVSPSTSHVVAPAARTAPVAPSAAPAWGAIPAAPLPLEPHVLSPTGQAATPQVGDPLVDDGVPEYDSHRGFRIDFDKPTEPVTAPIAQVAPPLPVVARPPSIPRPPAPPVAPRAEARHAARDKAQLLRRHKWLVLATTLCGLGAAALFNHFAKDVYEAYSLLLVQTPAVSGTEVDVSQGFAQADGTDLSRVLNQALIVQQAPAIAQQTAAALLARPDARDLSTVHDAGKSIDGPLTVEAYGSYLQREVVTVKPAAENVDAIRVQAHAGDPAEAVLIASLFTDFYQRFTRDANLGRVVATRDALEAQLALRQGELDETERRLSAYMTRENVAGLDAQASATVGNIGALQNGLDLARVRVRTQEAQLAQLQQDLASAGPRLQASAAAPTSLLGATALDTQISDLERLMEQVYVRNPQFRTNPYGHPDLAQMQTRLDALRGERQRARSAGAQAAIAAGGLDLSSSSGNGAAYLADLQRQVSQTRASLEGARAEAAAFASRLGEARGQLQRVPEQQTEIDQIQRQRDATEATIAGLRRELDTTELAATSELGLTRRVREVQLPSGPVSPKRTLNLAIGTLLGLLVGLVLASVRYQTDARAYTPVDLADQGFAVVGTVPNLADAHREGRQDVDGASVHPTIVTLTQPFSSAAEAFRHIHTTFYTGATQPQVVLVGGPETGSGKSVVATNLAVAAAQAGRCVLLVDADLRKPSVAGLLGLGDWPALGAGPDGSNLVYWSTTVPSLFAMTPRETAERPDQMWAPHQIGSLLANLCAAFDLVILDMPAGLVSADTSLLAPYADAAILVAEAGRTDLDAMAQVATELTSVGMQRIGAVLNRFDPRRAVGFRRTARVRHSATREARASAHMYS